MSTNANETETFGSVLKRHRHKVGLSQKELAERAGLSDTAIQALESGRRKTPRPETVRLLAEGLGLKMADQAMLRDCCHRRPPGTAGHSRRAFAATHAGYPARRPRARRSRSYGVTRQPSPRDLDRPRRGG